MSSNLKEQVDVTSKKIKKETILIIILCVLLIVALFLPSENILGGLTSIKSENSNEDYDKITETKLENLLKNVEGVGNVSVMVTLSGNEREVLAKNVEVIEENGVVKRIETVVTVNGKPYVTSVDNPEIKSVVVVCDGADDILVKMKICEIISSALTVPFENIKIYKKK